MGANLTCLKAIAWTAPLVGVLGTILGVLGCLPALGTIWVDQQGQLNPAIREVIGALAATAAGLAVSAPAVAASIFFQRRVGLSVDRSEVLMQLVVSTTQRAAVTPKNLDAAGAGVQGPHARGAAVKPQAAETALVAKTTAQPQTPKAA